MALQRGRVWGWLGGGWGGGSVAFLGIMVCRVVGLERGVLAVLGVMPAAHARVGVPGEASMINNSNKSFELVPSIKKYNHIYDFYMNSRIPYDLPH